MLLDRCEKICVSLQEYVSLPYSLHSKVPQKNMIIRRTCLWPKTLTLCRVFGQWWPKIAHRKWTSIGNFKSEKLLPCLIAGMHLAHLAMPCHIRPMWNQQRLLVRHRCKSDPQTESLRSDPDNMDIWHIHGPIMDPNALTESSFQVLGLEGTDGRTQLEGVMAQDVWAAPSYQRCVVFSHVFRVDESFTSISMAENARKHCIWMAFPRLWTSRTCKQVAWATCRPVPSYAFHEDGSPLGPAQGPFWAAEAFTHCYASQLGPQLLVAWWPLAGKLFWVSSQHMLARLLEFASSSWRRRWNRKIKLKRKMTMVIILIRIFMNII